MTTTRENSGANQPQHILPHEPQIQLITVEPTGKSCNKEAPSSNDVEISLSQKMLSAVSGSILTSLLGTETSMLVNHSTWLTNLQ